MFFKEMHHFRTEYFKTGYSFAFDLYTEMFVWIGERVSNKNRLLVMEKGYELLKILRKNNHDLVDKSALVQIDEGYEPIYFQKLFPHWQRFKDAEETEFKN